MDEEKQREKDLEEEMEKEKEEKEKEAKQERIEARVKLQDQCTTLDLENEAGLLVQPQKVSRPKHG